MILILLQFRIYWHILLNILFGRVVPLFGDSKKIIDKRLCHVADRIVDAFCLKKLWILPSALAGFKKAGDGYIIWFWICKKNVILLLTKVQDWLSVNSIKC